jgi:hypothetical protein
VRPCRHRARYASVTVRPSFVPGNDRTRSKRLRSVIRAFRGHLVTGRVAVERFFTLLLLCGVAACTSVHGQTVVPKSCRAFDLGTKPITVGNRDRVFVEPQAVALSMNQLLVAGAPSYFWAKRDSAFVLATDSIVAIIADSSGAARLIRGPLGTGRTHDVRAVGLTTGQWVVSFAEAAPLARPSDDAEVSRIWVGVLAGTGTWQRLEQLPAVVGRVLSDRASLSALSVEEIALAVPVKRNDSVRVSVFFRTKGHWRESQVMTHEANYTAMTLEGVGRLNLGVVHVDPSGTADNNSLWLYRTINSGESWSSPTRLVQGLGQPVHDPQFAISRGRMTASWRTRAHGVFEARAASLSDGDSLSIVAFGEEAAQVFQGMAVGSTSLWTTFHQPSRTDPSAQLRVWAAPIHGSPKIIGAFDVPFDGFVGVAASDRLVLTAGPVRGGSPSGPIISLSLHRLAVRCE